MKRIPLSTQILPACFAWGFFLGLTILFFCFPCRYVFTTFGEAGLALTIYDIVLTLLALGHFLAATCVDPGKYPKASQDESEKADPRLALSRNIEINGVPFRMKWCTTCQFYRPPRCSHCSVCDMCIDTFDHHCPWVNNCIGRRNYRYFVLFLLSLWIHMISVLSITIAAILHWRKMHDNSLMAPIPIISIIECCFVILFLVPVTGLSTFHIYLISSGRTTNEKVTGKIKSDSNPFTRGCFGNWVNTFFGPQFPRLLGRHPPTPLVNTAKLSKQDGASIDDLRVLVDDNPGGDHSLTSPVVETNHSSNQHDLHSKKHVILTDDARSVASDVIMSELNVSNRLAKQARSGKNPSKVNLIRADTSTSIEDYYIEHEDNSTKDEKQKLLQSDAKNSFKSGNKARLNGGSSREELRETTANVDSEQDNESTNLLNHDSDAAQSS